MLVAVDAGNEAAGEAKRLTAAEFALLAQKELKWLRAQDSSISSNVRIAEDVEGILVSKGVLNINSGFGISKKKSAGPSTTRNWHTCSYLLQWKSPAA
ncbi:hypothetical protein KRR40_24000 [Niabella defluvii]|nr:hypothetical protein KRR40_24000 [Niabella sp. I65]